MTTYNFDGKSIQWNSPGTIGFQTLTKLYQSQQAWTPG